MIIKIILNLIKNNNRIGKVHYFKKDIVRIPLHSNFLLESNDMRRPHSWLPKPNDGDAPLHVTPAERDQSEVLPTKCCTSGSDYIKNHFLWGFDVLGED